MRLGCEPAELIVVKTSSCCVIHWLNDLMLQHSKRGPLMHFSSQSQTSQHSISNWRDKMLVPYKKENKEQHTPASSTEVTIGPSAFPDKSTTPVLATEEAKESALVTRPPFSFSRCGS